MLQPGDHVPNARVWLAPGEAKTIGELVADTRALFLFYLFDWSST